MTDNQTPPESQYPWDDIPVRFMWAATDYSGFRYAYETEPEEVKHHASWSAYAGDWLFFGRVTYPCLGWRESLERRPMDEKEKT